MTKRIFTFACLLLGLTLSGGGMAQTQSSNPSNTTTMEKKLIGNTLALYPMPLTVVGAEVDGRAGGGSAARPGLPHEKGERPPSEDGRVALFLAITC